MDGRDNDGRLRLSDVGRLVGRAERKVVTVARTEVPVTVRRLVEEHLGADAESLEVMQESWPAYDHVNIQAGLDAWLAEPGRDHRLVGLVNFRHRDFGLSDLIRAEGPHAMHGPIPGNVARTNLPSGPGGAVRPCVVCGIYLVTDGARRAVLLLRLGDPETGHSNSTLEIASDDTDLAVEIAADVRLLALEHNVYRGQVVSFGQQMFGERGAVLAFHDRPEMTADDLILPEATITSVARQVVGVRRHREHLLASGQHLKRGLLLYGPPGVGKTHTVRYLVSQLTGTTIVLLSGASLHMIGAACSVARSLQPSMIVIEDVDLIAEDRGMHPGQHPLLFQLLNEMDGLAEDADVVFMLTTNRADILEPALAARPGRVDQAVELPLPDADARRRLFALYRGRLDVDESRLDEVLTRLDGVTASILKELLRRAAVLAAEGVSDDAAPVALRVSADQLDAALEELLATRNAMTRVLLGGGSSWGSPAPAAPGIAP